MASRGAWKQWALWSAAAIVSITLVASSPFVLGAVAPSGVDWARLSEISQAYGAVAVLFAAAAFLAAMISILYQAKQTRSMHEEIRSSMHKELIFRALEDRTLMQCWDPPLEGRTFAEHRQDAFCNLIYRLWLTDYMVGRVTLKAIEVTLEVHFRGEVARRHWRVYGRQWIDWASANDNRRDRDFVALTQHMYEKADAGGPPVAAASYFLPPRS